MLIAPKSENGHFILESTNWNALRQIFICHARNTDAARGTMDASGEQHD